MVNRILALLIRYQNIAFGSFPRLLSIFYWPTVQILFWGYFTNFFMTNDNFGAWSALNIILSAVVLWDVLFRGQLGLTMSFFEELWSRNLPNLFITPLKDLEIVFGLIMVSLIRTIIGITPAVFFANFFFEFHLFKLGFFLIFLFFNLIIAGWSVGFVVSGLVLRYGHAFEELAWALIFIILPFSCVYYPLESLPVSVQGIAQILPTVHIFESMRSILIDGYVNINKIILVLILNAIFILFSIIIFFKND
ncbi:MAG: ABC transporter permease [Alphaproteobacteria bacterium]